MSILDAGSNLLSIGRRAFEGVNKYGRIGMSAQSRQMLEGFYNGGTALFNQLYVRTENQEVTNVMKIMALRAQNKALISSETEMVNKSSTTGTNVDTTA
ncbi:MAG: hypothetical protein WC989_03705 [Micavibrio sp.]